MIIGRIQILILTCAISLIYGDNPVVEEKVLLAPAGLGGFLEEKFQYFENDNLVLDSGNGIINIHDYKTGLHVVQKEKNGTCFVYPTYHKYEEGRKVERYVASGKTIFTNVDIVRFEPLGPYSIKETNFLPAEAKDYCKGDYKWVEVVEHKVEHSNQKVDGKEVQKALDGPDMARSLKARGYCGICLCLCVWC